MSDSSDSDQGRIRFLNQAKCTINHQGRQLIHTILPVDVDNLFLLLYRNSKFLRDFHGNRKSYDMHFSDWQTDNDGKKVRKVKITVSLTNPVLPKSSKVTETMTLHECSKPGELYSFDGIVINDGIPYADSFYVAKHYCLSRTIDNRTEFTVYAEVKYKKSVFSFVKGIIEKNIWSGLGEFYASLTTALQCEYGGQPVKIKVRRKKRSPNLQPKPDALKIALDQLRTVHEESLSLRKEYDMLQAKAQLKQTIEESLSLRTKNYTLQIKGQLKQPEISRRDRISTIIQLGLIVLAALIISLLYCI